MKLLVLVLAMFVRALFLQPKDPYGVPQKLSEFVNRIIKNDDLKLVFLFFGLTIVIYLVECFFGVRFMNVLELLAFLYLFHFMYKEFPIISDETAKNREYLVTTLQLYDKEFEDIGQPIDILKEKVYQLSLESFFASTFVLMFCYLVAGWFGLLLYVFIYYLHISFQPTWLSYIRTIIEVPAGFLAALSCAVAGRMDAVGTEILTWRVRDFYNGVNMLEKSVAASTAIRQGERPYHEAFASFKNLCVRASYVWIFVVALVLIV